MNKNVLNKLSKIESKVELSEIKVDLGVVEQVKAALTQVYSLDDKVNTSTADVDKVNKLFQDANSEKQQVLKNLDSNTKLADSVMNILSEQFKVINNSAKDLGIDINTIPIYKEYLIAKDKFKSARDKNKSATDLLSKL